MPLFSEFCLQLPWCRECSVVQEMFLVSVRKGNSFRRMYLLLYLHTVAANLRRLSVVQWPVNWTWLVIRKSAVQKQRCSGFLILLVEAQRVSIIQASSVYLVVGMYIVLPDWMTSRLVITVVLLLQSFVEFCSKRCQGAGSVRSSRHNVPGQAVHV